MNKIFTKIATACAGLAMAIGVGVAIGNNANVVPAKAADSGIATYTVSTASSLTASGNPTGSTHTFSTNGSLNSGAIQLAGSKGAKNFTLTLTGYAGNVITGITINAKSNAKAGNGALSVVAGTTTIAGFASANFNSDSWYGAWSAEFVDCSIDMTVSDHTIGESESVVLTITNTVNSIYIKSVSFNWEKGTGGNTDERYDVSLTVTSEGNVNSIYEGDTLPLTVSATADGEDAGTLPYTYSSSDSTVATVSNQGVITGAKPGNARITVSYAGDDIYKPAQAFFDV